MAEERVYRQHRFALPAGACDILLIRHGESMPGRVDEPFATWQRPDRPDRAHSDPPLAPEGERQAQRLARRLATADIAAIYVTPLQRTSQTAEPLASRLGVKPEVEPDLIEVHLGEWEGVLWRQRSEERHPLAVKVFTEQRWDLIPGAEPQAELVERVSRGIERIAAAHADQRVAVVAHGGVIGAVLALAARSAPFTFIGADNASISQLVVMPSTGDRFWLLRRFNDTTHLDPTLTVSATPPQ